MCLSARQRGALEELRQTVHNVEQLNNLRPHSIICRMNQLLKRNAGKRCKTGQTVELVNSLTTNSQFSKLRFPKNITKVSQRSWLQAQTLCARTVAQS